MQTDTKTAVAQLRNGFNARLNHTYTQRLQHIQTLKSVIQTNEKRIFEALQQDFNKPSFETFLTELLPFYLDLRFQRKHLKRNMRAKRVATPLTLLPAKGRIHYEAKGVVLIIGAWNYPINLTLIPIIGALAAGNTVLLKPSEISSNLSHLLAEILNTAFDAQVLHVVEGDGAFTSELMDEKFDHVFYTGSTKVGQLIYEKAAKHLTPVTLELGGKSPAIFSEKVNLPLAVKRLLWGKIINAGQTCVAPDYALVPFALKEQFIAAVQKIAPTIEVPANESCTIINERHFDRINTLLGNRESFIYGGKQDRSNNWMQLTVLAIDSTDDRLMSEEIFGPILPVYFYKNEQEIAHFYQQHPDPLVLYIFSSSTSFTDQCLQQFPSGGVLVNDTLMHLAHENLPFGGRGTSGLGNYHGKASFKCFSHEKSVMYQPTWIDMPYKYFPYTSTKFNFLSKIVQLFK